MLREKLEELYLNVLTLGKTHKKIDSHLLPGQLIEFTKEIRAYLNDTAETAQSENRLVIEYVNSEGVKDDTANITGKNP